MLAEEIELGFSLSLVGSRGLYFQDYFGSKANRVASAIGVVNGALLEDFGARCIAFQKSDGPFVPDLGIRVVAPDLYFDGLSLVCDDRLSDREVEREPGLHCGGVLSGED